jgi:hypothetical protein
MVNFLSHRSWNRALGALFGSRKISEIFSGTPNEVTGTIRENNTGKPERQKNGTARVTSTTQSVGSHWRKPRCLSEYVEITHADFRQRN